MRTRRRRSPTLHVEGAHDLDAAARARTRRRDPASAPERTRTRRPRVQVARRRARGCSRTKRSSRDNAATDWLAREIQLYWKRVLKRIDLTSRSLVALIENGSCFAGFLAEILFACDRTYMMAGEFEGDNRAPAAITLTRRQFRPLSDVQRSDAAADALPRRARAGRRGRARRRARRSRPTRPASSASSPSCSTRSIGRTRCASSSRSARASRPTR